MLVQTLLPMNPWLETFCVIFVAVGGVWLGRKASRLPGRLWAYSLALPICLLGLLTAAASASLLNSVGPLLFITAGRTKYVILSFAITFGLTAPLSRLPCKAERITVVVLMLLFVAGFSVLPFLVPAIISEDLAAIATRLDANGICHQSTSYTCGPAAAVTALRRLGFPAQEGEIAVLARTNPVSGTLLWTLYSALKRRYADQGLQVAVLGVSDTLVTIADPTTGIEVLSHGQFERKWHRRGIVISKKAPASP